MLAQQFDECLILKSIGHVCSQPNPGSQALDGNVPLTLFTSYLGERLRLDVVRVRSRLGNSRGAKADQSFQLLSVFPGSVVASLADPTAADRAVGAAQTSVSSVLSLYGTTEFPSSLKGRNSQSQSKPGPNPLDSDKTAGVQHCRSASMFDEYECADRVQNC